MWFLLEEGAEGTAEDVIEELLSGQGGEGAETSVDGDVVCGGDGAFKIRAVDGACRNDVLDEGLFRTFQESSPRLWYSNGADMNDSAALR